MKHSVLFVEGLFSYKNPFLNCVYKSYYDFFKKLNFDVIHKPWTDKDPVSVNVALIHSYGLKYALNYLHEVDLLFTFDGRCPSRYGDHSKIKSSQFLAHEHYNFYQQEFGLINMFVPGYMIQGAKNTYCKTIHTNVPNFAKKDVEKIVMEKYNLFG